LLELPPERVRTLIAAAARPAAADEAHARYEWIARLDAQRPGDVGALGPLYLNLIQLTPGEAVYQEAGVLHAYLEGTGVEIMANSDNVLRGGMTGKHIDVRELLRVCRFEPTEPAVLTGERSVRASAGECDRVVYAPPFEEFELLQVRPTKTPCRFGGRGGPLIVLCTAGTVDVAAAGSNQGAGERLGPGRSAFIPGAVVECELAGDGVAYIARVPNRSRAAEGPGA